MTYSDFKILAPVGQVEQLGPLLTLACALAHSQNGAVTVLCVTPDGAPPSWLHTPAQCGQTPVRTVVRAGDNAAQVILDAAHNLKPDLLLLGWRGAPGQRAYLLGSTLDPVTRYAPCDVAVVRVDELGNVRRALVPMSAGPNAPLALELALCLSPDVHVTALNVALASLGPTAEAAGYAQLRVALLPWAGDERVSAKVVRASGIIEGILAEAGAGYDMVLIGASNESYLDRKLFGNVPQTIAAQASAPTVVVRHRAGPVKMLLRQAGQRLLRAQGGLSVAEQVETYREIHRGARPRPDFFVLIGLAAAIAALGLQMNSAAVIIGAMVIAPLMSAIMGISLGVVQGDARLLWNAAMTTLKGAGLAILVGVALSALTPAREVTPEILGRTQPTLFDLGVALISGVAGAYAQCRRDALSALSGVAIAVALVPPLATTGIGLTMASWAVAAGALLLFLTNLSAIVAAASVVFLFFGFRPDPGRRFRVFSRSMVGVLALLLAVFVTLAALTVRSFQSAALDKAVQRALVAETRAMSGVQVDAWEIESAERDLLRLRVRVQSTQPVSGRDVENLQTRVARRLQRPVALALSVVPITQIDPPAPSTLEPEPAD